MTTTTGRSIATRTPSPPTAWLRCHDGATIPLHVERWREEPGPAERALLEELAGPVLDVGCGPGRIAAAVAASGKIALGIDVSAEAIAEARRRGAPALRRSVFDPLPGEGRWADVLLLDGNIGIGGDPAALLGRCRALGRAGVCVVAEVDGPGRPTMRCQARVETHEGEGPWFPWAVVSTEGISRLARRSGFDLQAIGSRDGRWFATLSAR